MVTLAALVLGCDTDDGRELRPPPPGATFATTTTASGGTTAVGPGGTGGSATSPDDSVSTFSLALPFTGDEIDPLYSCDGDGLAPQISWFGVPDGTDQLALVVVDRDAGGYVHWVLSGLDPRAGSYLPDAPGADVVEAVNSADSVGWAPACPPEGEPPHRYAFTLYAIGDPLEIAPESPAADAIEAIEGTAFDRTTAVFTYERAG